MTGLTGLAKVIGQKSYKVDSPFLNICILEVIKIY